MTHPVFYSSEVFSHKSLYEKKITINNVDLGLFSKLL